MGIPNEQLIRWISRHVSDITPEGKIHHFELCYDSTEGMLRIEKFACYPELESEETELIDATEMSTHIHSVAEEDARSRRGPIHRYRVLAYRGDDSDHESMTSFTVQGRALLSAEAVTEPGDERGVTGQLMRHLEQTQITMQRVVEASMTKLVGDLEDERSRRLALEKTHFDTLALREKLLTDEEERITRRESESRRQERLDAFMQVFMAQVPMLLSSLGAAFSKSGAASAVGAKLKNFIGGLDEEKLASFASSLSPEQQSELFELMGELGSDSHAPK